MKTILQGTAFSALLALAACFEMPPEEQTAPQAELNQQDITPDTTAPQPATAPEGPQVVQAQIDWSAARDDFAKRDTSGDVVGIASGSNGAAVPVLLPEMAVSTASVDSGALEFRPTADGYFAVLAGEDYDMIINGTDRLLAAEGASTSGAEDLRYEETLTGAQVAFRRYGASYLVQFACKGAAAVTGGCIAQDDALAAVEDLLIAGTR